MKIETFFRHLREAYRGISKNRWMSFAAISSVAITLLLFGMFIAIAYNVNYITKKLDLQVSILASLDPNLTAQQKASLTAQFQNENGVKSAQYVSKEDALAQMQQSWGAGGAKFFQDLQGDNNPFPDGIRITPQDPLQTSAIADKIRKAQGVAQVDYGENVTGPLLELTSVFRWVFLAVASGLAILAALLISNTIKITIIARKREIEIQRLVGASNWFIRWPFFIEGGFIGVVGAVLPTLAVLGMYKLFYSAMGGDESSIFPILPVSDIATYVSTWVFLLGIMIGVFGSFLSIRRFLRI